MGRRLFIMELLPGAELPPKQKDQFTDLTEDAGRAYTTLTGRDPEGGPAQA